MQFNSPSQLTTIYKALLYRKHRIQRAMKKIPMKGAPEEVSKIEEMLSAIEFEQNRESNRNKTI